MGAVGGDILEVAYSNPSVGTGVLYPKSNEDTNIDLGGFRTADDSNMVDGAGQMIRQLNRILWMADFTLANDVNVRNDIQQLSNLAASPLDTVWTITHISGAVYKGTGAVVGDVSGQLQNATIKIKIAGGGTLKKIAG